MQLKCTIQTKTGEKLSKARTSNPFGGLIPPLGSRINYKQFRKNPNMANLPLNYSLKVIDVSFDVEEDWNNSYETTMIIIVEKEENA